VRARKEEFREGGRVRKNVSIVGAGAVGTTLGMQLFEKGCTIVSIVSRSAKPARVFAKTVRCERVSTSVANLSLDTELLVFSVPDDALLGVIRRCARNSPMRWRKIFVVHTSGAYSIDVLRPLEWKGAIIGSLHPIQSFPETKSLRERVRSLEGIAFGVEGEGRGMRMVRALARLLGGKALAIPKGMKPLYHAACIFASNYVVTLLNAAREASRAAGFGRRWREIMMPLFSTSVENALRTGPREALTGPIVRNDLITIELHLDALQKFAPQLIPLYCVAGIETARVVRQGGGLTSKQFRDLIALIRPYVGSHVETIRRLTKEKH